jgi:hypothetical protein
MMTEQEWKEEAAVGDVMVNKYHPHMAYVVASVELQDEGILMLAHTMMAQNPEEWTRLRKTVDTEELIQLEAEKAAAHIRQSKS